MKIPGIRLLGAWTGCFGVLLAFAGLAAGQENGGHSSTLTSAEQAALEANPALKEQYLQLARAQQLILEEARKANWEQRLEVQAQLSRARDTALAESWLQSIAEPPEDYPSEEQLNTAWEARKASFQTPRMHRLAQIFIACPKGADKASVAAAESKLAAVRKRIASRDEDFASVARDMSEDKATAPKGGEIGWLSDAQIQPELRAPVVRLLQHEISEPLRLNDGWHILKCLEKRAHHMPALKEVRVPLVKQLRDEKIKANSEAYVAGLLRGVPAASDETARNSRNAPEAK